MAGRPQSENRDLAAVALTAGKTVAEAAIATVVVDGVKIGTVGQGCDPKLEVVSG
jgi:hypothetical protein